MTTQEISLAPSVFIPVAIGFFGLAVGYFVWGGQALFGFPKDTPEVNRTMGLWGFWMPGFMQFITGVYLTVGLSWFGVFDREPALYMAALAFTAYGIHWFAMAYRRYVGASSEPDVWMAIPFCCFQFSGRRSLRRQAQAPWRSCSSRSLWSMPRRSRRGSASFAAIGLWGSGKCSREFG